MNYKIEFAESFDATGFSADQPVGAYSQSQLVAPRGGNDFALRASLLFSFDDQGFCPRFTFFEHPNFDRRPLPRVYRSVSVFANSYDLCKPHTAGNDFKHCQLATRPLELAHIPPTASSSASELRTELSRSRVCRRYSRLLEMLGSSVTLSPTRCVRTSSSPPCTACVMAHSTFHPPPREVPCINILGAI